MYLQYFLCSDWFLMPLILTLSLRNNASTAWKVSKYGVISGPYFPVFGLNTEYGPEITPYLDTFHAVRPSTFLKGDSGTGAFKNAL